MFSLLRHTAEPSCVLKAARGHEAVTHNRMGVRPPPIRGGNSRWRGRKITLYGNESGPSLGAFTKLLKATFSCVMSVRLSAWNKSAPTGRIFMKFDILIYIFSKICWENSSFIKLTRINVTLYEDRYTFLVISGSVLIIIITIIIFVYCNWVCHPVGVVILHV